MIVQMKLRSAASFLEKSWLFILGTVVVLASSWALFPSAFFRVHDFTHASRLSEMRRALEDGQFPVRWSANFGYGYGMPLFHFYGPLPYYLTVIPYTLGFSAITSLKLLLISINVMSFVGAYLLGKKLYGRAGGVVAGAVFTLFPYRALDLYARGAWNELFAIAAFPWVFLCLLALLNRCTWKITAWIGISVAAVCLSHNLMTFMFLPVAYAWSWWVILQAKQRVRTAVHVHAGFSLGVLLSAFYLLPAFLEKGFTLVDSAVLGGYFDFRLHFLYIRQWFTGTWGWGGSNYGPDDGLSFALGWVTWILAGLGFTAVWLKIPKRRSVVVFAAVFTAIALFMTTEKTLFAWNAVSLMKYFQFPWRFVSLAVLGMALLAGGAVYWWRQRSLRALFAGCAVLVTVLSQFFFFRPESYMANPDALYYTDPARIQTQMSGILPDYIPSTVTKLPQPGLPLVEVVAGSANSLEVLVNRSHEKLVKVSLKEPSKVVLRSFAFPGWTLEVNGIKRSTEFTPEGWFSFALPQGDSLLGLRLANTPVRTVANILSLFGLITVGSLLAYDRSSRS